MTKYNQTRYGYNLYGNQILKNGYQGTFVSRIYETSMAGVTGDFNVTIGAYLPSATLNFDTDVFKWSGTWTNNSGVTNSTTSFTALCTIDGSGRAVTLKYDNADVGAGVAKIVVEEITGATPTTNTYYEDMSAGTGTITIPSTTFCQRTITIQKNEDDAKPINLISMSLIPCDVQTNIYINYNELDDTCSQYTLTNTYTLVSGNHYHITTTASVTETVTNMYFDMVLVCRKDGVFATIKPYPKVESYACATNTDIVNVGNQEIIIVIDPSQFKSFNTITYTATKPAATNLYVQTQTALYGSPYATNTTFNTKSGPQLLSTPVLALKKGQTSGTYTSVEIPAYEGLTKWDRLVSDGFSSTVNNDMSGFNKLPHYIHDDWYGSGSYVKHELLVYDTDTSTWVNYSPWPGTSPTAQYYALGTHTILHKAANILNANIKIRTTLSRDTINHPTPYIYTNTLISDHTYAEEVGLTGDISSIDSGDTGKKLVCDIDDLNFTTPTGLAALIASDDSGPLTYKVINNTGLHYINAYFKDDSGSITLTTTDNTNHIWVSCEEESTTNPKHFQYNDGKVYYPTPSTIAINNVFSPTIDTTKTYRYVLFSGFMDANGIIDPDSNTNYERDNTWALDLDEDGNPVYRRIVDYYWGSIATNDATPSGDPDTWNNVTSDPNDYVVVNIYDDDYIQITTPWYSEYTVIKNLAVNSNTTYQTDLTVTDIALPELLPNTTTGTNDLFYFEVVPHSVKCNENSAQDNRITIEYNEDTDIIWDECTVSKASIVRGEKSPSHDLLPSYGVISIQGVYDSSDHTVSDYVAYSEATGNGDYILDTTNNCLDWSPVGTGTTQPNLGATYYVSYTYKRPKAAKVVLSSDHTENIPSREPWISSHTHTYTDTLDSITTNKMVLDLPPFTNIYGWTYNAIDTGYNHILMIMNDGTLWAMGDNTYGQLGDNTTVTKSSPVQISDEQWSMVAAGQEYSLAIKADGSLWAWGRNHNGQLGLGNTTDYHVPTHVGWYQWNSVYNNGYTSYGIKAGGTLWGWGLNNHGQQGDGTTTTHNVPIQLDSASWTKVAPGSLHVLALKSDGTIWVAGDNTYGQLGSGDTTENHTLTQIGTNTYQDIACGDSHCLAVSVTGGLFVWGRNNYGQLGTGTVLNVNVPTQICTTDTWLMVGAGANSSLAVTKLSDFQQLLWGWGFNVAHQVSATSAAYVITPACINKQVTKTRRTYKAINCNSQVTFALHTDKTIEAMGDKTTINALVTKTISPFWYISDEAKVLFPDLYNSQGQLVVDPASFSYTVRTDNKWVSTSINKDALNNYEVVASLKRKKPSENWYVNIHNGYYHQLANRYYLYADHGTQTVGAANIPLANDISYVNSVFGKGAQVSTSGAYISYPTLSNLTVPGAIYMAFQPVTAMTDADTNARILWSIRVNATNYICMYYINGSLCLGYKNNDTWYSQSYDTDIDITTNSTIVLNFHSPLISSQYLVDYNTTQFVLAELWLGANKVIVMPIDKTFMELLMTSTAMKLGTASDTITNSVVPDVIYDEFISYNQCLSDDQIIYLTNITEPPVINSSMNIKAGFNDSITDYSDYKIGICYDIVLGSPVIVKDADNNVYRKVSFVDIATGKFTTTSTETILWAWEDGKAKTFQIAYSDVTLISVTSGNTTITSSASGNTVTLSLTDSEASALNGKSLIVKYTPNKSFTVDRNGPNNTALIILDNTPSSAITISFEKDSSSQYMASTMELNPLFNPNNNGLLYISNELRNVNYIEIHVSPEHLIANGMDSAIVVIDCTDKDNCPTAAFDLSVSCELGTIKPFIYTMNVNDPYISDHTINIGSTMGRAVYIYTPPLVASGTATDHIFVTEKLSNLGITKPLKLKSVAKFNSATDIPDSLVVH